MMHEDHYVLHEEDRGPVPSQPLWKDPAFLLPPTLATPLIQQICFMLGYQWSPMMCGAIYFVSLVGFFQYSAWRFNTLGRKYGTFNEKNRGRNRIPDESADIMASGILMYFSYRVFSMVRFYYDPSVAPVSNFGWTILLRWQLWFLVMDYFFYTYHRATHEVPFLWRIHALHHNAKAPTIAHSVLGSHAQHIAEIIIIPTLTTMIVPLSFHEQWVLYLWLAHIETMGHTGIRLHAPCVNSWASCLPFGAELTIEDHDLHHRYGMSGKNYGKATRFWDKMFGTLQEREETKNCTTSWIWQNN